MPEGEEGAPSKHHVAIRYGKAVAKLTFSKRQEGTADNTGRDTEYNFEHLPGSVFETTEGSLTPGKTHFITDNAFLLHALVPLAVTSPERPSPADRKTIQRIEKLKNRKVVESKLLAKTEEAAHIGLFVFERKEEDMLASLVYVGEDKLIFRDYPATYDETSTWRADGGDEVGQFEVLFLAHVGGKRVLGATWAGPEGENAFVYQEKDGTFEETSLQGYRYWSPE